MDRFPVLAALLILLAPTLSGAANYYIRDGGQGISCTDWTTANACDSLPETLQRGVTYYVASGTYGGYTFAPLSGTQYVYIRKATDADHGTDIGWQTSYGTGEALFQASGTVWTIKMNNLDVDGVTGSGTSGYGIHLSSSSTVDGVGAVVVPGGVNPAPSHVRLRHLEMNNAPWGGGTSSRVFFHGHQTTTDWVLQYNYIHGGRVGIGFVAGSPGNIGTLIEYNVLKDIGSDDSDLHCTMANFASGGNVTIRYNVFWNMQGRANTAYIEPQFEGSGFYVYGNVFREDSGVTGTGSGIFAITSTDIWTDVRIYNNLAYNLHTTASLLQAGNVAGSTVYLANNNFQKCNGALGYVDVPGNIKQNVNNIINTPTTSLVNPSGGDFHLIAATAKGLTLPTPYNKDPDGNTRGADGTWDIGAYEYISGPQNGACGAANGRTYIINEAFPGNFSLCSEGGLNPANPALGASAGSTVSWQCIGIGAGSTSASCSATRGTAKFNIGDRVKVTDPEGLWIRDSPGGTHTSDQSLDALGTVIGGPVDALVMPDNVVLRWWNVDFDTPPDGWTVEGYLERVASTNYHPADTGRDWALSTAEVSTYNLCWKTPTCTPSPATTYVSNANLMWKSRADGAYHYAGGACPLCWVSGA